MSINKGTLGKGSLVKRKHPGGHVMTVIGIDTTARKVTCSYQTPDGVRHNEEWSADDLKRVLV